MGLGEGRDVTMRLVKLKEVVAATGLSRSSIYALIAEGLFPRPLQVGRRAVVRWIEQEVQEWLSSRPRSGTDGRRV